MSEQRKEEQGRQYRQGDESGETHAEPGRTPGGMPGYAGGPADPAGGQAGHCGEGRGHPAGAAAAGEATAAMGGAPHPGYFYGDWPGPMQHPPYVPYPSMAAAPYPPYHVAPHPAHTPGTGYWGPPAGVYSQAPPAGAYPGGQPHTAGMAGRGPRNGQGIYAGMADLVNEVSNGGSGLSSLGKLLDLDDSEFWKGALIGAVAVLLLTNESVQNMILKTGTKAKEAVKSGVATEKE